MKDLNTGLAVVIVCLIIMFSMSSSNHKKEVTGFKEKIAELESKVAGKEKPVVVQNSALKIEQCKSQATLLSKKAGDDYVSKMAMTADQCNYESDWEALACGARYLETVANQRDHLIKSSYESHYYACLNR